MLVLTFSVRPRMLNFCDFWTCFQCSVLSPLHPLQSIPARSVETIHFCRGSLIVNVINCNVTFPSLPSLLLKWRAMNNNDLHISVSCELCSLNTPASPGESGVICSEHAATQGALAKKKNPHSDTTSQLQCLYPQIHRGAGNWRFSPRWRTGRRWEPGVGKYLVEGHPTLCTTLRSVWTYWKMRMNSKETDPACWTHQHIS